MQELIQAALANRQDRMASNPWYQGRQVVEGMQYQPTTRETSTGKQNWMRQLAHGLIKAGGLGLMQGMGERRQAAEDQEMGQKFTNLMQSANPAAAFAGDADFAYMAPYIAAQQYSAQQSAASELQKAKLDMMKDLYSEQLKHTNALDLEGEKSKLKREEEGPQKMLDRGKGLRTEFMGKPEVADFSTIDTMYQSLLKSYPDTSTASDLDFVFGVMKILDPTSVVREGEQKQAIKTQGIPDYVWGMYQKAQGKQGLGQEARQNLLKLAGNRYDAAREKYSMMENFYKGRAQEAGVDFGAINPYTPRQGAAAQLQAMLQQMGGGAQGQPQPPGPPAPGMRWQFSPSTGQWRQAPMVGGVRG